MSEITFRLAKPEDLPAAGELWTRLDAYHRSLGLAFAAPDEAAAAWIASFERTLGRFSFLWVAECQGRVGAFLLARLKRTPAFLGGVLIGEISDLYVAESLRGQKAATRLAELALAHLRSLQVHSIEVQVLQGNAGGLAFWQSLGFRPELVQLRLRGE